MVRLYMAIENHIRNVVPSQHLVRPEVMKAYRRSNETFRQLYEKLAKQAPWPRSA